MCDDEIETMDMDDYLYVRKLDDVKAIIKHAKLDERNLTPITQALYYPPASIASDNLKLLQLDDHMLAQIRTGKTLHFKGGLNEKVVLCTDEKTYDVKGAEISNSLLLVPDLKFAAATSTSPLKSPHNTNNSLEQSLDSSIEDDEDCERVLEQRQVLTIFHEYFECREIHPRFRKLHNLLQMTRYSGPENEECIDHKLLFTYEQLLDTIQCSRQQFADGIRSCRALEFEGFMRVLECDYEFRIVNVMVSLISENSWKLDEIEREETIQALEGISPQQIVDGLFGIYTEPTPGKEGKFTYREDLVARIVAQNILQPGLKFRTDEFMLTWSEALPEGMSCVKAYLRGLCIFDREGTIECIRSLAEENLPTNIHERMKILFKAKQRWLLEEMEPYIECFTTPALSISMLLAKYARSLPINEIRYYVAKH